MESFKFDTCGSIAFGAGSQDKIVGFILERHLRSVMIITDPGIHKLGLLDTLLSMLKSAMIDVSVFSEVCADPTSDVVKAATASAQNGNADVVIGFGGGSSLDVAKLVAVLAHAECQQTLEMCFGTDQVLGCRLPLLLVPTTAGTGSEVTPIAIVTTSDGTKSGVVDTSILPDVAVLDPLLTLGLPAHITAATGVDAMVHAIEAFTSAVKKNPISDGLASNALKLLSNNIRTAVHNGQDVTCRGDMLLGSLLAGQAFANAPVGGVHALAYPLGGTFHIPHGLSNALMLTHVLRFNMAVAAPLYATLADIICPDTTLVLDDMQKSQRLIDWFDQLLDDIGVARRLRDCGISEADLPLLAEQAMLQTRLLVNNPRPIDQEVALSLYQQAY